MKMHPKSLSALLQELPVLREQAPAGYQILDEEHPCSDEVDGLQHVENYGTGQQAHTAHLQADLSQRVEESSANVLFHSSGLVQKVLIQKLRVLASHLTEINEQIQSRRTLSQSLLAHFDRARMSLRNDELHLEALSEGCIRDPNGLNKGVTTSQMHQINREIAHEQQQVFRDEMKLLEEKRRVMERYEQYKQSLALFLRQ